jgi:hypothetical protein
MSSEDPWKQDPPPGDAGGDEGVGDGAGEGVGEGAGDDTAPYGYSSPGGASPYGVPAGPDNPYAQSAEPTSEQPTGPSSPEPTGQPAGPTGGWPGAAGGYGQDPYGAPTYQPTYQQPSGYPPPPQQWGQPQQPGYPYGPGGPGYPGQQTYRGYPGYPPEQTDGLALAAMIVGIASLVLVCAYGVGLLGSPVAMVMGRVAMKRIDRSGGRLAGRGMAQTGFILGIIGTVLLVLTVIAVVVVIVIAVNGGFDNSTVPATPTYNS